MAPAMFEYEARGWWFSGGEIGTAGPRDVEDSRTMLNFILNQTGAPPPPRLVPRAACPCPQPTGLN